jgi:hypothetical protein
MMEPHTNEEHAMKTKSAIIAILAMTATAQAADLRIAAGGLAKEDSEHVVQAGINLNGWQPTYTYWHDQRAASLLYGKRWEYVELAAGAAYTSDSDFAGHARAGLRFGPIFIVYESLIRDGRGTGFAMGGIEIPIGKK